MELFSLMLEWTINNDVNLLANQNPVITISTKAVFGVKTDPHNDHRFASFEETNFTGNICLWDDRKPTEAISF